MNIDRLSNVKCRIIQHAYQHGYVTNLTQPKEKLWLFDKGWLQPRRIGNNIISGEWELTIEAIRSIENRTG